MRIKWEHCTMCGEKTARGDLLEDVCRTCAKQKREENMDTKERGKWCKCEACKAHWDRAEFDVCPDCGPECGCEAVTPQPPPTGDGENVFLAVMTDIQYRAEFGRQKYGTYLKTDNGRDALMDAYQEALDLVMYLKQAIMEGKQ